MKKMILLATTIMLTLATAVPALAQTADFRDSALYDAAHAHILRPKRGRAADTDG